MAVYLAPITPNAGAISIPFRLRNVEGHTTGKISSITVGASVLEEQPAYVGYRDNVSAFIYATSTGVKTPVSQPTLPIRKSARSIPISTMAISFSLLLKNPPLEVVTKIRNSVSPCETAKQGSTLIFTAAQGIKDEVLGRVLQVSIEDFNAPGIDSANLVAAKHIGLLLDIAENFLATQTYPAFSEEEEHPYQMEMLFNWTHADKGFISAPAEGKRDTRRTRAEVEVTMKRKKARVENGEGMSGMDEDYDEKIESLRISSEIGNAVFFAKPSPFNASYNIVTPASLPNLPGLFFPYFPGMNPPDASQLKQVLLRHFIRNLCGNFETHKEHIKEVLRATQSMTKTATGQELTHLYTGIDLSIQTQSRLVVVKHEGYAGFCLLGERFAVLVNHTWFAPLPAASLQTLVHACLPTREMVLEKLCEMMSRMTLVTGGRAEIVPAEITGGSKMAKELARRKFEELSDDDRKEFEKHMGDITFEGSFLALSVDNLVGLLELAYSVTSDIADEANVYIPGLLPEIRDPHFRLLGRFGPSAPSFRTQGGMEYTIPPITAKDELSIPDASGKLPLPSIIVGMKPLRVAYADWRAMVTSRKIKVDLKERAKGHRNHVYVNADRNTLWSTLRKYVSAPSSSLATSSNKRGREDEDGQGGSSSKRPNTAADVLALFEF